MTTSSASGPPALPRALREPTGGGFYLHGEDHFRKEEALKAIVEAHADPATRDFNVDVLRGGETDPETLASLIATPPMMSEWRVVVLREVEALAASKHARDLLVETVTSPPPGLALVMSCTVPERSRARIYKDLARLARSAEFEPISEADAPGWIIARAKDVHGCDVDVDAARTLASAVSADLGVLVRELEKLAEFVGTRGRITLADVETAGTRLPSQDRWKWLDMVAERRFERARATLPVLLAQGESGVGLVIALASQLLRIGVALDRGAAGLQKALPPFQQWLARSALAQAKHWSVEEVDHALDRLLEVDRALKSTSHGAEHLLETWLMELRVVAEAAA